MPKQYKEIFRGKTARTLELLREEQEPKTPLEILIEEEENEFDVAHKKHKHLIKMVKKALGKLTIQQKKCIKKYFIKKKTQVEIAKELNISKPAVCQLIRRGKNNLKNFVLGG